MCHHRRVAARARARVADVERQRALGGILLQRNHKPNHVQGYGLH